MDLDKQLTVDIGNTRVKFGLFEGDKLIAKLSLTKGNWKELIPWLELHKPNKAIISVVGNEIVDLVNYLKQHTKLAFLNPSTSLPFTNKYATPQTLGMDRIAGVAGAMALFPNTPCLVIDVGTCVTFDYLDAHNCYLGGAISPGLQMRLNAMSKFTQKLPQLLASPLEDFIGDTTQSSMLSGAFFGLLGEINDTIDRYESFNNGLSVLICGGDSHLFDKRTKKTIFAAPDLVLIGLNKIANWNE